MSTKMFVNLAVKDLKRSMAFWESLGYHFNPQFSDETAACLVFGDDAYAMLLTHEKFRGFSPNAICDTSKQTEVLVALSCESKEDVAEKVKRALAGGAKRYTEPKDYGFMVQDSFQDLDGHVWELFYMDPNAVPQ
ncbi:VOC family protein [Oligoflexus tunisiensis]|uniref:VOC family protein n=1 Tax=Oligoflexus tunisiensis TaxID=708132 RepID=UPI00114CE3BB|nr:VOC family protein [Oligoflexus tunisiensis]